MVYEWLPVVNIEMKPYYSSLDTGDLVLFSLVQLKRSSTRKPTFCIMYRSSSAYAVRIYIDRYKEMIPETEFHRRWKVSVRVSLRGMLRRPEPIIYKEYTMLAFSWNGSNVLSLTSAFIIIFSNRFWIRLPWRIQALHLRK